MPSNASVAIRTQSPSYQAYQILHLEFVVAPGDLDVALRDLGLALGASALSRLATEFDPRS